MAFRYAVNRLSRAIINFSLRLVTCQDIHSDNIRAVEYYLTMLMAQLVQLHEQERRWRMIDTYVNSEAMDNELPDKPWGDEPQEMLGRYAGQSPDGLEAQIMHDVRYFIEIIQSDKLAHKIRKEQRQQIIGYLRTIAFYYDNDK